MRDTVKKEMHTMLALSVIEPSNSPYCSPRVIVKKNNGSYRCCLDFSQINQPEAIYAKLRGDIFFSKCDFSERFLADSYGIKGQGEWMFSVPENAVRDG